MKAFQGPSVAEEIAQEEKNPALQHTQENRVLFILKIVLQCVAIVIIFVLMVSIFYFVGSEVVKSLSASAGAPKNQLDKNVAQVVLTVTPAVGPQDWQTYVAPAKFTTAQSPFSFKYPPNWQIATSLRYVASNYVEDVIANNTSNLMQRYVLTIDTISAKTAKTLQEFISQHQTPESPPNLALNHYEKDTSISIPNTDWMIDRNASGTGSNESVILLKGSTAVLLTCSNCTNEITNQIISTFKFSQ